MQSDPNVGVFWLSGQHLFFNRLLLGRAAHILAQILPVP